MIPEITRTYDSAKISDKLDKKGRKVIKIKKVIGDIVYTCMVGINKNSRKLTIDTLYKRIKKQDRETA